MSTNIHCQDSFPPLWSRPHWLSAHFPNPATVDEMQLGVSGLLTLLREISSTLAVVPYPPLEELRALPIVKIQTVLDRVIGELRVMEYPPELTSWISNTRSLANRASMCLDTAVRQLQQMSSLVPTSNAYHDCAGALRWYIADIVTYLEQLVQQLDAYELMVASDAHVDPRSEVIPEHLWNHGHRAGLHEAMELVQAIFLAYADSYPPPVTQAIETITAQLLEELRMLMCQEPDSGQFRIAAYGS